MAAALGNGRLADHLAVPVQRQMGAILQEQEGMLEGILDRLLEIRARIDGTNSACAGAASKSDYDKATVAPPHTERMGRISGLIERIEHAVSSVSSFV